MFYQRVSGWIELLFIAATKATKGGKQEQDKVQAMHDSLSEWMDKTAEKLGLIDTLEELLAERLFEEELSVESLRAMNRWAQEARNWKDSPDYKPGQRFKVRIAATWASHWYQSCPGEHSELEDKGAADRR